jgi:hypothetical protein
VRRAERARSGSKALELVRALSETALAEHRRRRSGDNVGVAALWLSE